MTRPPLEPGRKCRPGTRNSQIARRLDKLLGKLLRIDVDVAPPAKYAIPPDNPFVGQTGARGEIWAYGLRNPWRFTFDRLTGDIFIGDVGQDNLEEIDFQPAGSPGGENYGWRRIATPTAILPGRSCSRSSSTATHVHANHSSQLPPNGHHPSSKTVRIPAGTVPGTYQILVRADTFNVVAESNEGPTTSRGSRSW